MDASNERIEQYIDELLADDEINQAFVPDVMERAMYRNVLRLSVRLLERLLRESRVEFLGHTIKFTIEPNE